MVRNFLNLEEPQGPIRWPREIAALLAVLSALLIYFQYTTLDKFSVLPPARRYATLHLFIQVVKQNVPLDTGDAVVAGLIVAAFASLIVLELWKKRLSTFLCKVFETETRTLLAVGLTCLLCVRFYFARGDSNLAADTPTHISYAWVASQAFSHGEIPIWTNYFGAGSPYLQFYGFLFFYLCGLVDLLFRDLFFSIKLVMAGGHVFSGIGMYLFVRTLCDSRRAGFLAGIAYVLSVWHIQQVLIMGRLPLSVFYALLPYPFYFFERLLSACLRAARRQACGDATGRPVMFTKLPCAIGGGLTLALLAFTHPGRLCLLGNSAAGALCVHTTLERHRTEGLTRRCFLQPLVAGGRPGLWRLSHVADVGGDGQRGVAVRNPPIVVPRPSLGATSRLVQLSLSGF